MSNASQFANAGIPRPAGVLNGTAVLRSILTDATTNGPLATDALNAKSVLTGALTANTLATVLSLSGKGAIDFLACQSWDATSRTHRMKVTLDGVVIFDATSGAVASYAKYLPVIGSLVNLSASAQSMSVVPQPLMFNTSLLVEYASSITETAKTYLSYNYYPR